MALTTKAQRSHKETQRRDRKASMRRILVVTTFVIFAAPSVRADDWPQWFGPKRDGVWREDGILEHQSGKKAQFGAAFIVPHKDRFFLFTDAGNLILADLSPKGYRE